MKVKLEDIAEQSGYSIATVSRVLSGKAVGRSASVEKILTTARDLGYRTKRPVYNLENLPIEIALVVQHHAEEFYSCLYETFDRTCSNQNVGLRIHSVRHTNNIINDVKTISQSTDGIILMTPTLTGNDYQMISDSLDRFPLLSIAPMDDIVINTITFDSYQGGALAAKLLVESGYKKFGVITGPLIKWEANLRRNGFVDYLRKNGFHITWEFEGDYSFQMGEVAFKKIAEDQELNIGLFSSNDQMALGFLHSALEYGYKIPDDFGIVGYDNMPYSKVFYPNLSTINTDLDVLASSTINHIKDMIKNLNGNNGSFYKTLLPVSIVKRKTHGGN